MNNYRNSLDAKIMKLRASGERTGRIANLLGCSTEYVRTRLKAQGVTLDRPALVRPLLKFDPIWELDDDERRLEMRRRAARAAGERLRELGVAQ